MNFALSSLTLLQTVTLLKISLKISQQRGSFVQKNMHKLEQRPNLPPEKNKNKDMQGNELLFISRAVYRRPILTK